MFKASRTLRCLPIYRRLTHTVTPEHHFFPDRIGHQDVQALMRDKVAQQAMRAMLNYRGWIVPMDASGFYSLMPLPFKENALAIVR